MKRNTVNKIKYAMLILIGLIAASNLYMAKKVNDKEGALPNVSQDHEPKPPQQNVKSTPITTPPKKDIPIKTESPKTLPKTASADSSDYGIIKRKAPIEGDEVAWTKYYESQYSPQKVNRVELRELYLKVNKSPDEIKAMLDEFDEKIAKLKAQLETNPDDEDLQKLLNRAYKTKAYIKVIGKRFEDL